MKRQNITKTSDLTAEGDPEVEKCVRYTLKWIKMGSNTMEDP